MAEKFGEFLATRREALGLSQGAVAKAVGVSRPYITQIELGTRSPSDELVPRLFSALGITMEDALDALMADHPHAEAMRRAMRVNDLLNAYLTPEQLAEVVEALGTQEQFEASLQWYQGAEPITPAPEGWSRLRKSDRTALQQIINRILEGSDD